jgi:DNA (cytosine-5)-methyltransferase 1
MTKFIDLFAGIGAFRTAFEQEGYTCVFSSEKDKHCQETYFNNYGEMPHGDITKIDENSIPDFDTLLAGFPCQPFSISGTQKGFEDTRGTLFFDVCRIINAKKPKCFVLENVKNLLSHDNGNTMRVILSSLKNLGYHVSYKVLNSKDFGLPQSRERVFIVGTKKNQFDFNQLKPLPESSLLTILENNNDYITEPYTIIEDINTSKNGLVFCGYLNDKTFRKKIGEPKMHLSRYHRQANRIYSANGKINTLVASVKKYLIHIPTVDKVRPLTINECYKTMGFNDDFKKHPNQNVAFKQIGNSIAIPVANAIAKELKKYLNLITI